MIPLWLFVVVVAPLATFAAVFYCQWGSALECWRQSNDEWGRALERWRQCNEEWYAYCQGIVRSRLEEKLKS